MKVSLSLVGNYMCKNPPIILLDITGQKSEKDLIKKYVFNTPADIQRNLQSQFVRLNGSETIMYTKFSHEVLTGLVNLVLALYDNQKKIRFLKFKLYGTQKHYDYFQMAKFHLGEKILAISYCTWLKQKLYRLGIVDDALYQEILRSDKFSSYVWKINWRLEKEPKQKINNSCDYLRDNGKFYEDEFTIIKPFMQKNPAVDKQAYYNSPTHYLCILKPQHGQKDQLKQQNQLQKAMLIITYQSVQQINNIIQRKDSVDGINNNLSLLDFIQSNLSENSARLQSIVHIIQNPQLVHLAEFYHLHSILDDICYSKGKGFKASHLFYGYGIKSSTTNIHHLLNTYYKGIRFYSICSKLFKFIPNITLNHYSYWNKIFDKEFINVIQKIQQNNANQNSSFMEVYKPLHKLKVYQTLLQSNPVQNQTLTQDTYMVSSQLQSLLKYPIFSTAMDYRPTKQLTTTYEKKAAFLGYTQNKGKNKKIIPNDLKSKQLRQFDPKVIFLGTNSKTPNQFRNVSGILINLPKMVSSQTLILLDCGSGTYEQFMYHYTPQQLPQKLIDLKVIFMTHLHADHNLGILDLITQRNKLLKERNMNLSQNKAYVILPFNMFGWIQNYCKTVINILQGCQILFTQTLTGQKINVRDEFFEKKSCSMNVDRLKLSPGKMFGSNSAKKSNETQVEDQDYYKKYIKRQGSLQDYVKTFSDGDDYYVNSLLQNYGFKQQFVKTEFDLFMEKHKIKKFLPSKVFHCPFSYGVIIEHNNGVKISYSGDCRPTPEFLQDAKQSTLLIHEATFETNNQSKAEYKLHSTFHQALQAGMTSNCHNTCVTHFTPSAFDRDLAETSHQSLYKPQVLDYYKKKAIIACDHLQFKLSQMDQLVKVSKIISNIGTNNITQKNHNPFSLKFQFQQLNKNNGQNKVNQNSEENELD